MACGLVFLFLVTGWVFSDEETYPQRVVLDIPAQVKQPSVSLLYKAVLAEAARRRDILVYSSDPLELSNLGVTMASGRVELVLSPTNEGFLVGLNMKGVSNSIQTNLGLFETNRIVSMVPDTASRAVDAMRSFFPPLPKREVVETEIVKENFSEFETTNWVMRTRLIPKWDWMNYTIELSLSNNYTTMFRAPIHQFALLAEQEFQWHQFILNVGLDGSFGLDANNVPLYQGRIYGGVSMGFFGSLVVLGLQGNYLIGLASTANQMSYYNSSLMTSNSIPMPLLRYEAAWPAMTLRINMSRDLFVELRGGIPFDWFELNPMFWDSTTSFSTNFTLGDSDGPPMIELLLSWKISPRWRLCGYYSFFSRSYSTYNDSYDGTVVYLNTDKSSYYLEKLSLQQSQYGLGLEYVW